MARCLFKGQGRATINAGILAQSAEMGALPTLFAATVPGLPGDSYVGPDGFLEQRGHPRLVDRSKSASVGSDARRLWSVSEDLTGVRYLDAASDIGRQPVIGRRDDEGGSHLGMLGQQRGELGRLDSERNSQLAVVLRFDEDWIAAAEDEAIDD